MKIKVIMAICAMLSIGACQKEKSNPKETEITQIPEQETIQPVIGTTVTSNNIVYTRIDQDLSYNKFITIDADNNGKNDFYFTSILVGHNEQSHLYLVASPVSASGAKLLLDNSQELVIGMWCKPLSVETPIGAIAPTNTTWSNFMTKGIALDVIDNGTQGNTFNGPWVAQADKYLAMQIIIDGKIHYGWIKLTHLVNEARMKIVGFAYNNKPAETIITGQIQ